MSRNQTTGVIGNLLNGLSRHHLWVALAVEDIRSRYMRSFLGMAWIFVSFAAFVGVKTVIFTPLSDEDLSFFAPYVTIGFFVWTFLNATLVEGSGTFIGAQGWIKGARLPLSIFAYQTVTRNCILTVVNFLVVILVLALARTPLTWDALWVLPLSVLYIINAVWVTLFFSVLGARFRDFGHLVTTIMRVMMFLTPIFWLPDQMGELWDILIYNPLAHFIILMRDPILYGSLPMLSLKVVLAITVVGWTLALVSFKYARQRIVFWL